MWNDVIARQMVTALSRDLLVRGEAERRARLAAGGRSRARTASRVPGNVDRVPSAVTRDVRCLRAAARAGA